MEKLSIERLSDIGTVDLIRQLISQGESDILLVVHVLWVKRMRIVVLAIGLTRVQMVYKVSIKLENYS